MGIFPGVLSGQIYPAAALSLKQDGGYQHIPTEQVLILNIPGGGIIRVAAQKAADIGGLPRNSSQAHIQAGGQLRQTGGPQALVFQHQIPCPGEDDTVKVDVRLTVVVRHALGQIIGRQMPDIVKQVARVLALLVKAVAIFVLDNGPEDIRIGFIQSKIATGFPAVSRDFSL